MANAFKSALHHAMRIPAHQTHSAPKIAQMSPAVAKMATWKTPSQKNAFLNAMKSNVKQIHAKVDKYA